MDLLNMTSDKVLIVIVQGGAIVTKYNINLLKIRYSIRFKMHKLDHKDFIEHF